MSYLTIFVLVLSIITASIAQIVLKKGALAFSELRFSPSAIFNVIIGILKNKWLLAGAVLFVVSFCFYIFVLTKIQLTFAYPVMVSAGMILVALGSNMFLGEQLSLRNIIGIAFIILGILLLIPKG